MNVVCLMGRLTAEPELKTTQSGVSVTSFSLAVDRAYTPKGQEKQTDFIRCVAWRQTAEFVCRYFHKGQRMGLHGELQARRYTDADGAERTVYEVIAAHVYFADGKSGGADSGQPGGAPDVYRGADFEEIVGDEDLLPF